MKQLTNFNLISSVVRELNQLSQMIALEIQRENANDDIVNSLLKQVITISQNCENMQ